MLLRNPYIFIILNKLFYLYLYIIEINSYIMVLTFTSLPPSFHVLVIFTSPSVIIVTIDYLSIMEPIICSLFIYSLIIVMLHSICSNNVPLIFIG